MLVNYRTYATMHMDYVNVDQHLLYSPMTSFDGGTAQLESCKLQANHHKDSGEK